MGDKYSHYYGLDAAGEMFRRGWLPTTAAVFLSALQSRDTARIAVAHILATPGHDVLVANARKLRVIHTNDRKSDQVDLARIARLVRKKTSASLPADLGAALEPVLRLLAQLTAEIKGCDRRVTATARAGILRCNGSCRSPVSAR